MLNQLMVLLVFGSSCLLQVKNGALKAIGGMTEKDVLASTEAALKFLTYLHEKFEG